MKNMGFEQHEIQESVTGRRYNNIMGTYLILDTTKTKMKGHTIRVGSCPSPEPSISLSPTQEVQVSGQKRKDPASPPPSLEGG